MRLKASVCYIMAAVIMAAVYAPEALAAALPDPDPQGCPPVGPCGGKK